MNSDDLIESAWSPPASDLSHQFHGDGRLVSLSIPAEGITLRNFLRQAEGQPRFFWQQAGSDDLYAGFGTAVQLMAWGENRFEEIRQKAIRLFDNAAILGAHLSPIRPRLFGGFAFRDDFTPDNTWSVFHPAHFVLPHYQLVQNGDSSWLTINAQIGGQEELAETGDQLHQALKSRYRSLINGEMMEGNTGAASFKIRYPMPFETWAALIENAIQEMGDSMLEKVVLARVSEMRAKKRIDVYRILEFLNDQFQDCTRFLFEPRPFHAFFGATPELLAKVRGKKLSTMALAGSMPRGKTAEEDEANASALTNSAKECHEHHLVVEAIQRRLEPISEQLEIPSEPSVLRLSYIQHLLTPISGVLQQQAGILPLVQLLHPTPAMGGSPRELAMVFISNNELVPRGWYAAPVGWFDSKMDGEFVVAIRSAVAQERRVWCYAGAGIVPDSKADVEWAETELKFRPMLRGLGIDQDQGLKNE